MISKEKLEELKGYIMSLKTKDYVTTNRCGDGFLSIEYVDCCLVNGEVIKREKLLKKSSSGSAVIILPIKKNGNVILTVQPRVFTKESVGVELPAGYIEEGEIDDDASIRELVEETGLVPEKIEFLREYYQDQGISSALNKCYIATGCEEKSAQRLDSDEYVKCFECTYDEAIELMELGYIKDAGSIITLTSSKQKLKRR